MLRLWEFKTDKIRQRFGHTHPILKRIVLPTLAIEAYRVSTALSIPPRPIIITSAMRTRKEQEKENDRDGRLAGWRSWHELWGDPPNPPNPLIAYSRAVDIRTRDRFRDEKEAWADFFDMYNGTSISLRYVFESDHLHLELPIVGLR